MLRPNRRYKELKDGYLFNTIYKKTNEYLKMHPDEKVLKMGVGDVSLPLCQAVIEAMHKAVDDQGSISKFHGYMPEIGSPALRQAIHRYYRQLGAEVAENEVFISSGACDDLCDILELFDTENTVMVIEPAYPEYVDTNILAGRRVVHLTANKENGFLPMPLKNESADIIYICSPNNPTGAAYTKKQLSSWVDFANKNGSVIIFDAAYEVFIEDSDVPHSIFEVENADKCAIEICSLSKTAGFTGTRLGYTVVPKRLVRENMSLNEMWSRNRETRTNGVSYILQKGAEAVFTDKGQEQIRKNIEVYKENARYFMKALDDAKVWYTGGKNSPYIWMKCPNKMTGWEFFDYLIEKTQIVGVPGDGFGECGKGYFRFSSFGTPVDTKEAAKRLCNLLKDRC